MCLIYHRFYKKKIQITAHFGNQFMSSPITLNETTDLPYAKRTLRLMLEIRDYDTMSNYMKILDLKVSNLLFILKSCTSI